MNLPCRKHGISTKILATWAQWSLGIWQGIHNLVAMVWVDVAFRTAALASTVIATLRAGSRAAYLIDHSAIGVMEGPSIHNPGIHELSEAFRHAIRLGFAPDFYEEVEVVEQHDVVEPYPLSTRPYIERKEEEPASGSGVETLLQIEMKPKPNFLQRVQQSFSMTKDWMASIPSTLQYSGQVVGMSPKLVSYWTQQLWKLKDRPFIGSQDEEEELVESGTSTSV